MAGEWDPRHPGHSSYLRMIAAEERRDRIISYNSAIDKELDRFDTKVFQENFKLGQEKTNILFKDHFAGNNNNPSSKFQISMIDKKIETNNYFLDQKKKDAEKYKLMGPSFW